MKRNTILHAADAAGTGGGGGAAPVAPAIVTKEDFSRQMDEGQEILNLAAQYQARYPEVVEMAKKAIKDNVGIRKFMAEVLPVVSVPPKSEPGRIVQSAPTGNRSGRMTVGEAFATSEAFKDAMKRGIGRGKHFAVEMPNLHSFQQRATFSLSNSDLTGSADIGGTGGIGITVDPTINLLGKQAVAVANLFGQGQCSGDQIRIVRQQTLTSAAARVAEGGNKPESSADLIVVNFPVEKTAVFLNVTEEMLADVAQAASFINEDLAYQVQAKEDEFLLNGSGSSEITGILNTSGIQTLSGAVNTVDKIKAAIAYVEGANGSGFAMPDAILMNPLDWLSISLSKDNNGQYLFGGPGYAPYGVGGYSNMSQMWGLNVVTTRFIAQGTAIVGAFKQGATLYRRAGLTIRSTDSHASNFIANIVTVLAESRFALAVKQPNKFCTITGIPAAA